MKITDSFALLRGVAAIVLATSIFVPCVARAADIIWGTPQTITGATDVSTNGNSVGAFNVGDAGVPPAVVNSINFESYPAPSGFGNAVAGGVMFAMTGSGGVSQNNNGESTKVPFTTLPSGYQTLLSSYVVPLFSPATLTMSGLIVGAQYEFEFWSNQSSDKFSYEITATGGANSVALRSNDGHADGGLGEWVVGSFTADALTQSITFLGDGDGGFLNGFQLRQIPRGPAAVPESANTLGLLVLGICGLGFVRRRHQQTATAY